MRGDFNMLLRFNVKNFLSFNEMTEFSMFPGKVRSKENHLIHLNNTNILRFSALYGANAAGKSNLVKSMKFSQKIILSGTEWIIGDKYFKVNDSNKNINTSFEYEIYINNKCYAYGFNILLSKKTITGEWLYEITNNNEELIFERDLENRTFSHNVIFKNANNRNRFKVYSEDYKFNSKVLLLNEFNRNKEELYKSTSEFNIFKDIYMWFKNTLDINYADEPITNFQYFLGEDFDFNRKIIEILDMFGTGITDFKLIDSTIQDIKKDFPSDLLENIPLLLSTNNTKSINLRSPNAFHNIKLDENGEIDIKTVTFKHGNTDSIFYFADESDGTKRLMDLIEILINTKNKVFVVDEIDRSLHPNLTYKFIELFLNFSSNLNSQLIITTHEDRVLDLDLLRRDEIWFAEKDKVGATNLYSLENYHPRFDTKTCKAYLEGRYGAIPQFKSIDLNLFNNRSI